MALSVQPRAYLSALPALGVLAVAFALALLAAGDYGLAYDQLFGRRVGRFTVDYVLGANTRLLEQDLRYKGAAFEIALLGAERVLGLTDEHHIFLSRYLLCHAFFLVGALACYLLAHQLFKSRALALAAMAFFLCHPRLYGHSFFNSRDMPFLSMVMISLLLAHWVLRRGDAERPGGNIGAFAALGAWLGVIGSIRPMAFLLVALIAVARCADLHRASGRERTRVLASAGVMASLCGVGFFAALPYLWGDPLARFGEWFVHMTDHAHVTSSLFLGELISTDERPHAYVPVWIAVTTPPLALVLALIGGGALCGRLAARPRAVLLCAGARFKVLLAACVLAAVVVATFFVGNLYNGWRHLYFLYGPLCLGAAGGLAWLCRNAGRRLAVLGGAIAAAGLVPAVSWAARLHPHEHVYFNFLVDRKTPERLRTQFDMEYWAVPFKEALLVLLDAHPGQVPITGFLADSVRVLPAEQRRRVALSDDFSAYFITDHRAWWGWGQGPDEGPTYSPPAHVRKVFSNTLYAIVRPVVDAEGGSRYRADHLAALSSPAVAAGPFDVHWDGEAITYLRKDCEPADIGVKNQPRRFFLRLEGYTKDAPAAWRRHLHSKSFPDLDFRRRGVVFMEGSSPVCMMRVPLRGFEVDAIRTGQLNAERRSVWSVNVADLAPALYRRVLARVRGTAPAARGGFDLYTDDGAIVYVKENCVAADRDRPFFLHVVPLDSRDVPRPVAWRGFENRDFSFTTHGAMVGRACVARVRLPRYPIRALKTGQFDANAGEHWRVEVALAGGLQ